MIETDTEVKEAGQTVGPEGVAGGQPAEDGGFDFTARYQQVMVKVNETLEKVDWSQMALILKVIGIFLAVIIAQVLIKGVLDTINLLPILPGLLELLGLYVVVQWSWNNLTTSEKRSEVMSRFQQMRKDYLG
jgi:hypothetical protein